MMKKLFCILFFSMLTFSLAAQEFEVPRNYEFKNDEDYSRYEEDVLKGIDWLLETPPNVQPRKRKEISTFVIMWLIGTQKITVEVRTEIVDFKDSKLLLIFMCGWTKYSLENKDYDNMVKGNQKGLEAVIEFYQKHKGNVKKNKSVEKYIKLNQEGKLEDYIAKILG